MIATICIHFTKYSTEKLKEVRRLKIMFCLSIISINIIYSQAIVLDEKLDDWSPEMLVNEDFGDGTVVDIRNLYLANDDESVFVRFEFDQEISLQDANDIIIYFDMDNNTNTGTKYLDIGADFIFNFGSRRGNIYDGQTISVFHNDVGLVSSPTVTGTTFEVAFSRNFEISGVKFNNELKVYISTGSFLGDIIPNENEAEVYTLKENISPNLGSYNLLNSGNDDFRVLSYNVLRDNIFENNTRNAYQRIISNINADIMCFQEIYDHDEEDLLIHLNNIGAINTDNESWYASKDGRDLITVSKYPIKFHRELDGNSFVVIDKDGQDIVIFNCHLPCCDNNAGREEEIDVMLLYLRRSLEGTSDYSILSNTPYMILGDMNFVGFSSQVNSLRTGDIKDNNTYGPDFDMDWDSSPLFDLSPRTTGTSSSYTWYNPGGSFSAGRLDYLLFTDAILQSPNSYALNTSTLTASQIQESGFNASDILVASDHFPIVADFNILETSTLELLTDLNFNIYPNPVLNSISIDTDAKIKSIQIIDMQGRIVFYTRRIKNNSNIEINNNIGEGLYNLLIEMQSGFYSKKIVLNRP